MNPFLLLTAVGTIFGLKRTCPACKRDQVVPASKKRERVRCKFCGAEIPPRS